MDNPSDTRRRVVGSPSASGGYQSSGSLPAFSERQEGDKQQLAQVTTPARVDLCSGAGPPVDVRDPFRALDFALALDLANLELREAAQQSYTDATRSQQPLHQHDTIFVYLDGFYYPDEHLAGWAFVVVVWYSL